jgi:DNA-binding transcriptional regulator YiaG
MQTIKDIRLSTGLSQAQFSAALNIPKRTIQDWEQGLRNCPEYVAELIEYRVANDASIPKVSQPM